MDGYLNRQHTDKAKRVPDLVHIVLHPRHQFTGIGFVKKRNRQRLDMPKQIFAKLRTYF